VRTRSLVVQFRPHTDPRPNGYTVLPAGPRSVYTGDPALIQAEKYGMHVAGRAITLGMHRQCLEPYRCETGPDARQVACSTTSVKHTALGSDLAVGVFAGFNK
jgi:hypothetical protein